MTATYRKISDVVQAFRYGFDETPEWFRSFAKLGMITESMGILTIDTTTGDVYAEKGDWILKGRNDTLQMRKHFHFLQQYERVTDDHMRN